MHSQSGRQENESEVVEALLLFLTLLNSNIYNVQSLINLAKDMCMYQVHPQALLGF